MRNCLHLCGGLRHQCLKLCAKLNIGGVKRLDLLVCFHNFVFLRFQNFLIAIHDRFQLFRQLLFLLLLCLEVSLQLLNFFRELVELRRLPAWLAFAASSRHDRAHLVHLHEIRLRHVLSRRLHARLRRRVDGRLSRAGVGLDVNDPTRMLAAVDALLAKSRISTLVRQPRNDERQLCALRLSFLALFR